MMENKTPKIVRNVSVKRYRADVSMMQVWYIMLRWAELIRRKQDRGLPDF